ncbi:MAG: acetyl-CoA C-acyltransferase [Bdellovibrionota bacterium]
MTRVAIVGGTRTPFVKAAGAFARYSFMDLGVHVIKSAVSEMKLDANKLDELIFSTVLLDPRTPNAARELVLRSGISSRLNAHFISNNCISGLVAANMISEGIKSGRINSGLAGGSESMSQPTLTLKKSAEMFFLRLAYARSLGQKLSALSAFRPSMIMPQPPSPKEPSTQLTMGQHQEMTSQEFNIPREAQDEIAYKSHANAAKAQASGVLAEEITPLGKVDKDNIVRADTSVEKLAKLRPVFDRSEKGTLTAGNSSPLTDGASVVCLMSEAEAKAQGREPLAFIERVEFSAIDPNHGLLMAPGLALPALLNKSGLTVSDIDYFEVHEAFASQVLSNMAVWENGWAKYPEIKPIGKIPMDKLNVNGSSIAIGHPFAATGGRLLLTLANQMKRTNAKKGVISVCAAGAMGCAVLLTR